MMIPLDLGRLDRRAEAAMDRVARRLVSGGADVHRGRLYGLGLRAETVPVSTPAGRSARSSASFLRLNAAKVPAVVAALQPFVDSVNRAARELSRHPVMRAALEAQRMRAEREGRV